MYLCSNSSSVRLFTFLYPISYHSVQFFRRALHYVSGGRQFLHRMLNPPWGSVCIVIHRKIVWFYQNSSVWLDMQDARSRDRNPWVTFFVMILISAQHFLIHTILWVSSHTVTVFYGPASGYILNSTFKWYGITATSLSLSLSYSVSLTLSCSLLFASIVSFSLYPY